MTDPPYEYHGMMAQTWDLFRGDTSKWEDRSFYLDLLGETGQPVLDVGCGTGRLLLDYLSQEVDIDGVDISPEMLRLCREKAETMGLKPTLYEGDMETMRLPRRYQTILVPSSSFQLLIGPDQARRAMRNFFAHLLPGGWLVMPFMLLRKEGESLVQDWEINGEKSRPEDGATVKRWSKSWFDPQSQLEHNEDRYEVIVNGVTITSEQHLRSPATRQYSQRQALDQFIAAGFVDLRMYKGFTRQQADPDDELFTICGEKP